ncbi:glycosyltransferase [Dinoroseobacter sp. S76]|uniref:glycosyltransferase n=1 Tax=Dinoroseobacter sp. S76 TaxID=3415124 RepID=UPI003C7B3448
MDPCRLSIIIITLNEETRLPRLLDDLAGQSWTEFEIILVDSQSEDATVEVARARASEFERYKIIEMDARGVSLGRNTGAEAASGERLLFLDADTRLPPYFVGEALHELDRKMADVGIVLMSAQGLPLHYKFGFALFNLGIRVTRPFFPTAIGACLFSTPQVHCAIGGFDEAIGLCEDCDYVLRAARVAKADLTIIEPKFWFDPRRLSQDGFLATGFTYLKANLRRFFLGEMRNQEIPYRFGHYK